MALTWLADVLRDAGLTVVEHAGWKTRAVDGSWSPTFGVIHGTGAPRSQPDETQVRLVRDGHSTLDGPISNACVDRAGRWHVLAGGRCNSTLVGTAGPFKGRGNVQALSTEACNDNIGEPWPSVQYAAYVRGWAAWCRRLGWSATHLVGHKEHDPKRKIDPSFDMATFRADVARAIAGAAGPTPGDEMPDEYSRNTAWRVQDLIELKPTVVVPETDAAGSPAKYTSPNKLAAKLDEILAAAKTASAGGVDVDDLAAKVADRLAPLLPTAEQVADVLAERLAK